MLSGVGPSSQLTSLGIDVLVDHPAVGQNLADQPLVANQFNVSAAEDDTFDPVNRNTTLFNELLQEWQNERQGLMTSNAVNHLGWLRLPANDSIWKTEQDPSAGPTSPHYEFLFQVRVAGFYTPQLLTMKGS